MPIPLVSTEGLIPFDNYGPESPTTSLSHQNPEQQKHEEKMEGQWQAAEDIDKDVNALNSSINSLIQTFGLDPALLEESMIGQTHDSTQSVEGDSSSADFDFDSFFNNLSTTSSSSAPGSVNANSMAVEPHVPLHPSVGGIGENYGGPPSATFFDEAPTPSTSDLTSSPAQSLRQVSPELNTSAADGFMASTGGGSAPARTSGRKRKSDVVMDFNSINTTTDGMQGSTKGGGGKSKRRRDK